MCWPIFLVFFLTKMEEVIRIRNFAARLSTSTLAATCWPFPFKRYKFKRPSWGIKLLMRLRWISGSRLCLQGIIILSDREDRFPGKWKRGRGVLEDPGRSPLSEAAFAAHAGANTGYSGSAPLRDNTWNLQPWLPVRGNAVKLGQWIYYALKTWAELTFTGLTDITSFPPKLKTLHGNQRILLGRYWSWIWWEVIKGAVFFKDIKLDILKGGLCGTANTISSSSILLLYVLFLFSIRLIKQNPYK